jgi:hypothetical protein
MMDRCFATVPEKAQVDVRVGESSGVGDAMATFETRY